jgi:hypothetical protein
MSQYQDIRKMNLRLYSLFFSGLFFLSGNINSDSFQFNSYNNHGAIGIINMPSARFYDESSFGITVYDGTPDQKITLTSSPFDWLEASFFYTNIQGLPYPGYEYQDYKDKGFNIKLRLKEQGLFPALAMGINDIAGTGFYSGEYIVGSYEFSNLDFHLGLGWGALNGKNDIRNPFVYLDNSFRNRPLGFEDEGGQLEPSRYFSDEDISIFFGLSYILGEKMLFKFERDTTKTDGLIDYDNSGSDFSFGLEYKFSDNFSLGIFSERDDFISLKFLYKQSPNKNIKNYRYKSANVRKPNDKYHELRQNLSRNGVGVNKIYKKNEQLGLELTQFTHGDLSTLDYILDEAIKDSNITEEVLINYKIVNLDVIKSYDESFIDDSDIIFNKRGTRRKLNTNTSLNIRPFLAAREGFLKAAILAENDTEYLFKDNLIFSSNLKISLWDNFQDLTIPPRDTYPNQVRSDVKDYLRGFNDGIVIGRAQVDYFKTIKKNHHIMFSSGIFEEMFNGYGMEYLYFVPDRNYAFGFEAFKAFKRDYKLQFGMLDYETETGHLNFYYRNYKYIPFDAKISYGKYLAGDKGATIELSRNFRNGVEFGAFATFTDVSTKQFGEGSFDKGIFFNVPIFRNYIDYKWRPLTKDPGQKLLRKNNLHDLLIKFKRIE